MTVRMEKLPVVIAISSTHLYGDEMIDFRPVLHCEVQSTASALPILPFQEICNPEGQPGIARHPPDPIHPVAIIGAFRALDFGMPANRHLKMLEEGYPIRRSKVPGTLVIVDTCQAPILSHFGQACQPA